MKNTNKNKLLVLIDEIIQTNNHRTQIKDVFDDLIQLTFNITISKEFQDEAAEGSYLLVKDYLINELDTYKQYPKAWELLQEASLELMRLIYENEPFEDVLGDLYDQNLGKKLGQFLTPKNVAKGSVKFMMADIKPLTEKTIIGDPAGCGSGSLILSQLQTIYQMHGKDSLAHIEVVGMDIDYKMIQLTALQVMLQSCIHHLPIKSLLMFHGHGILDYESDTSEKKDTLAVKWILNQ